MTEVTRVGVAIQTGTSLDPEEISEPLWLEKRIGSLLTRVLKGFIDKEDFGQAFTISKHFQETLQKLSSELLVDEAVDLFQRLKTFAHDLALNTEMKSLDANSAEKKQRLAVALGISDVCGMGIISILIGFSNALTKLSAEQFLRIVAGVDFSRPKTFYDRGLPRKAVEQLEHLGKLIKFEVGVEGNQITRPWYSRQIAALGMCRFFTQTFESLLKELESTYAVEAESLSVAQKYAFAAQIVQRGLEACHKFHFRIEEFKNWFKGFETIRYVTDIPWPEFDAKKAHESVKMVRNRLLSVLANSADGIATLPVAKEIPDYLGQTYVVLADECYRCLAEGEEADFARFYLSFFAIAIAVQKQLSSDLTASKTEAALPYITEPVEDVLAISGYALIYSELDGKRFWQVTKGAWDAYLNTQSDITSRIKLLLNMISYRRSLFAILPRDLQRTAWTQDLMRRFQDRGLSSDMFGISPLDGRPRRAPHSSPLIRVLAGGSFLSYRPTEVFVSEYLMRQPQANSIDEPESVKEFRRRIDRENKRKEGEDEE
jgi:hypothetical protein